MNKHTIKAHLKCGYPIWCEGEMVNIYDIAKKHNLSNEAALAWAVAYWVDHN